MPTTQRWVDLGNGIEELIVEEALDERGSDSEPMRRPPRYARHIASTPPESPAKSITGLITPPKSNIKKARSTPAQRSERGHDNYEHKLTVLDSRGKKLPRMAFRW